MLFSVFGCSVCGFSLCCVPVVQDFLLMYVTSVLLTAQINGRQKKQLISSRLSEIYLVKDVWEDWDCGRIWAVYPMYGLKFSLSGVCIYNHYFWL